MLGKEFRKLREEKRISLYEVSKGITSKSSLQRWENGKGEMSIEKVSKLLERIHIQPKEYIDKAETSRLNIYTNGVDRAYRENNISVLKKIATNLLKKHNKDRTNMQLLFQTAVACNFYFDLSNVNLFPDEERIRLEVYFQSVENWTRENTLLFANVQLLLTNTDVYILSRSLLSYLIDHPNINRFYIMSINSLINSVFVLMKKKSIDNAYQLLEQIKNLNIPERFLNEKIRIKFMEKLLRYIYKNDDISVAKFINNLDELGLKKEAKDFSFAFKQIHELYNE